MKQEIVARLNLYEYVSRFVVLQHKSGNNYLGLCPFHQEKTPSFSVNVEKQFFYCFGCRSGGDIVKFVMLYEKLEYEEAIKKLALEAGIKVSTRSQSKQDQLYFDLNGKFAQICNELMFDQSCYYGIEYLRARKIKEEAIKQYQVGYFPHNRAEEILKRLKQEFAEEAILKAGLFKSGRDGKCYSQFMGRVIFPIADIGDKIVGFGSRVINDNIKPKYINSAESSVFHKSELLYGLNKLCKDKSLKESKTVFVFEGYMDVISLANHGITNCVGVLGANLSPDQLHKLWQLVDRPVICFDNDRAGSIAMERVAMSALTVIKPGKSVAFLELHGCKDPDEFINKNGAENFLQYFTNNKILLADYLYKSQIKDLSIDNPDDVVVLKQRITKMCDSISNDGLRNEYKRYFNKLLYSKSDSKNNLQNVAVRTLKSAGNQSQQADEEKICKIIAENKILLMDQEILDYFMLCEFKSRTAETMRLELTKDMDAGYVDANPNINEVKRTLKVLLISLLIQNIQSEISALNKNTNNDSEREMIQLKKYEIQLKNKLSSALI